MGLELTEIMFYNGAMAMTEPVPQDESGRTRYMMEMVRRALLLIVAAIERVYNIDSKDRVVIIIERD